MSCQKIVKIGSVLQKQWLLYHSHKFGNRDYPQGKHVGWSSAITQWEASNLLISQLTAHQQPEPTPDDLSHWSHSRELWDPSNKAVLDKCDLGRMTCDHLAGFVKLKSNLPVRPVNIFPNFYPLAFLAEGVLSLLASVPPSVRKLYLVCTITHHRFELESLNLHQTCILRYSQLVLKMGVIDLELWGNFGQFYLEFYEICFFPHDNLN